MSYTLSFGKHEGRTLEWLFFHDPNYAEWFYASGAYRNEYCMNEEETAHFRELYRRAWSLTGVCPQCRTRPIQRMGLTYQASGLLGTVGYYCAECEYQGGARTEYQSPAFFSEFHEIPNCDNKWIIREIKRVWIGRGRLTQEKMEAFFYNDANFPQATAGFFQSVPAG